MGEDPNGRLPNDVDEPSEPLQRPLPMRLREAANSVAVFLDMVEEEEFPIQDQAHRDMFRAALMWLENSTEAARRVYIAQVRGYHRRRARKMEVDDRLAGLDAKEQELPI